MQFTTIDKQGYNWCRNESQHKIWEKYYQTSDYIEQASGIAQGTPSSKKPLEVADVSFDTFELPQAQADERVQITNFTHKHTMRSLYESTPLIRPKLTTVVEGRNNQTYDYKGNESAARRIQESKEACRNLFLTFYYGIKQYPRSGSTSLIELKEHSITIYKKWEARNGLLIKLWKENGKWMLRLDK
ncbi:MAG: hypothetical protein JST59_02580 [Actinobacteria bacterium]|nr:hypothetical protein [Actinomycetota bacterium]